MDSLRTYLQQFPHYDPTFFEEIAPHLSQKQLSPGDYFIETGKRCRNLAFVEKGLLRVFYVKDGIEVTQCFCKENSFATSYTSLLTQQVSDVAIQAIEQTRLLILSYEALQQLYTQNLFWQQLGRMAAEHELIFTENHNRMLNDLSATERYECVLENENELLHRVPLRYLASYLQIRPETLSRVRSRLAGN